ncbi:MAG TPA: hypothetical protein VEX60_17060 [Pyrinomonadaceae bacterium]|nr:hypothetical protein [Pyrinomonadaceae bacterium]
MNLLEILRSRVDGLPEGDYTQGLKAVLQHIEVASRHLERGQADADDTAFTDAIYRTNQAFEGSLKEAYRVLTSKDPAGESPYNIENYLQQQNVLRPRVLAQLTNYRREWRNPSTHDYRLDFDEDEALLAIVTVSAFAIVLIDQITERISFEQAKIVAAEQPTSPLIAQSLLEKVSTLVEQFTIQFNPTHADRTDIREVEIIGALTGFLAATAPELKTLVEVMLAPNVRVDLLITSGDERLILEVKRGRGVSHKVTEDAVKQVTFYMGVSSINQAILFIYNLPNSGNLTRLAQPLLLRNDRIVIISVT